MRCLLIWGRGMKPYAKCSNCGNEEPMPTDSCTLCWQDRLEVTEAKDDACADDALATVTRGNTEQAILS